MTTQDKKCPECQFDQPEKYGHSQACSHYKESTTPPQKIVCSICLYGDGKWNEGRKMPDSEHLPVCEKCKADGWTNNQEEIRKAIVNTPLLKDGVSYQSPYQL